MSSADRYLRARARPYSRRPKGNPPGSPPFSPDAGRFARCNSKRNWPRSDEDQAVAAIKFPQYEQLQGYKSQGEVAVRRTYREIMGTLK